MRFRVQREPCRAGRAVAAVRELNCAPSKHCRCRAWWASPAGRTGPPSYLEPGLCWNESAWRWDSVFGTCGLAQYCKRRVPRNHCSGVLVDSLTRCTCPATAHALGHSRVLHCPGPWNASQGPVEGLSELRSSMTSWGRAHPRQNKSCRLSYPSVPTDAVPVWSRQISRGAFEAEAGCMLRGAHSSQRGPHAADPGGPSQAFPVNPEPPHLTQLRRRLHQLTHHMFGFASVFDTRHDFVQGKLVLQPGTPDTIFPVARRTAPLCCAPSRPCAPTSPTGQALDCRDSSRPSLGFPTRRPQRPYPPASPSGTPPPMSDTQESPNLDDLTPEEANRIIHSHRKVRYGKWAASHPVVPGAPPTPGSADCHHASTPGPRARLWDTPESRRWLLTLLPQGPLAGHADSARSSATTRAPVRTASSGSTPSSAPTSPTGRPPGRASQSPRTTPPQARRGRGRPTSANPGGA